MSLACLAHVNFLLHMYSDLITEQINDDDDAPKPIPATARGDLGASALASTPMPETHPQS